ncbi:MAG: methyltransferase domain-containing protein [Oscillospiraceae bacterium]
MCVFRLETGYADEAFDGTVAHSVLDHMTAADAKKALAELLRITKTGGLLLLSFDSPEDGPVPEHVTLADGSLQYTGDSPRQGMILHPYTPEELDAFVKGRQIVYRGENSKGEQVVILRK